MAQLHRSLGTPGHEARRHGFLAIAEPNRFRQAAPGHHLPQDADHAFCRERRINLNGLARFPPASHLRPGPSVLIENVAHEIHGPPGVGLWEGLQRLAQSNREPLFSPAWQAQS